MNNPKLSADDFLTENSSIEQDIQAIEKNENKKKRTLALLLDEKEKAEGYAIEIGRAHV